MRKFFIFLGMLVLCIFLGELMLQGIYYLVKGRSYYNAERFSEGRCTFLPDPDTGYVDAPNIVIKRPPPPGLPNAPRRKMFYDLSTDAHGFRFNRPLDSPKPLGEIRVFCLGGSTTYGAEVPNQWTYPQQLDDLFHDPSVNVINAGVGGYRSIHLLTYYKKYIRPLQPDIITIYCGWNDYEDFLYAYWKPKDPHGHCLRSQFDEYINSPVKNIIVGRLLWRAYYKIMNYNRSETISASQASRFFTEADSPVWQAEYKGNLQALIDEARKDGCIPVLIMLPSPTFPGAPKEAKDFADADLNMSGRWEAMVVALQAIRKNLHQLARENQIPLIDVNQAFDQYNQDHKAKFKLFVDRMHLTKEGNTLIATTMYPEIKALVEGIRRKTISGSRQP
jgi:lysophospholipase L1-like esterase